MDRSRRTRARGASCSVKMAALYEDSRERTPERFRRILSTAEFDSRFPGAIENLLRRRREQFNHVPVRIADEKLRSAVRTTLARQVFHFE